MTIRSASHIAIGVRDMERSLPFYRDLLGMKVSDDQLQTLGTNEDGTPRQRRAVFLRWDDAIDSQFVVLDQQIGAAIGEPAAMGQVGVHHIAFWVDDLASLYRRLVDAGTLAMMEPMDADSTTYGEPAGRTYRTVFVHDPDGTIVQFDQR